jgi:hypothetical protein
MRASRTSRWRMSFVAGFADFRELHLRIDTISKPCGLGSEGPLSGQHVPVLSRTCPTFVSVLSRFYSASFRAPEGRWKTSFTMF